MPSDQPPADDPIDVNTLGPDWLRDTLLNDIAHFPSHVQESVRAANGLGPQGPLLPGYMPPLTLAEYLDPRRFPLTTCEGVTPLGQLSEDGVRFRNLWEYLGNGGKFTPAKRVELLELMRKVPNQPSVLNELSRGAT